jgi:5-oxopent-3-ene-1,2,5-tricarboxylate decarboxylase / 2-hydroxyhepta-2,4-diene-1,7-dioate isomerase
MGIYDRARGWVEDDVLAALRRVSTATAWATLVRKGIRRPYMMGVKLLSVGEVGTMVGRARTLRYVPLREDLLPYLREAGMENPQRAAIEAVEPGDVFVVDAMGSLEAATMGDILASRIKKRGAAGIVADGCVRDSPFIKRMGIPVYTRSVHPAANTSALLPLEHGGPIQCGGVTVLPGDVLLGDEEGVVVIPPAIAAEIAADGPEHEELEVYIREQIEAGRPISEVYPPNEQVRAAFAARRGAGARPAEGGR